MNKLGDLKFDTVKLDTSLAEEYLKNCKHEFHTVGSTVECDTNEFALDNFKNKVYFTQYQKYHEPEPLPSPQIGDLQKTIRMLAKKLEENVELFAQLEYLIRKVPIDEVKNYDMKLLIQHMYYCSRINDEEIEMEFDCIVEMVDDSPLFFLGRIVHVPRAVLYQIIKIEANTQTAAICYLFTQLCHEVGLNNVTLTFNKEPRSSQHMNNFKENGGVGVVTECSDIDSAVDTFFHTPLRCPWRLSKILVQESVYEQFKQTLRWKCGLKDSLASFEERLNSQCLKFSYKQKHFLIDSIDYIKPLPEEYNLIQYISVEAYRTTKELFSLVTKLDPYCLSLWSSDYSGANEIAFGVSVPIVWINNFGTLDGPEKASQSLFRVMEEKNNLKYWVNKDEFVRFSVNQQSWNKMSYMKRVEILQKALKTFKQENDGQIEFAKKLEKEILLWDPRNELIEIENGRICVVEDKIRGVMAASKNFMSSVKLVLQGTLIVCIEKSLSENEKNLINCFEKEHIPIKILDGVISLNPSSPGVQVGLSLGICRKIKAVWSNFGTIFAN